MEKGRATPRGLKRYWSEAGGNGAEGWGGTGLPRRRLLAERELSFRRSPAPSLSSLGRGVFVCVGGTLITGCRVGWAWLPASKMGQMVVMVMKSFCP